MKHLLAMAAAVVLTLGLTGLASAAAITCGDCHSAPPVNADNCNNNARGLHGTHVNYSSASFPKTVANYGKCAYCHTATTGTAPTATHNNNYVNITGNASPKAPGLDFAASTCTNACHKNAASTAPWGNYTATTVGGIKLGCVSCHGDVTNSAGMSGAHAAHLGTAITTSGTQMGAAGDAGCVNCHPDNTNDLWSAGKADDGSKKAYPHASDGTNVVSGNANVNSGVIGTGTRNGLSTTCTGACHTNTSTALWGDSSLACDACHYYAASPTSAGNTAANVALGGSHGAHFDQSVNCDSCHGTLPTDTGHVTALPVNSANATVLAGLTYNTVDKTCSSTGASCHGVGNTTPAWGNPLSIPSCAICHNFPTVASKDWAAGNGHASRYDGVTNRHLAASGWNPASSGQYTALTTDGNSCGMCHNGATHRNGTVDVNPNGHNICGTGDFTFDSGTHKCSSVSCHSGKTTPDWR